MGRTTRRLGDRIKEHVPKCVLNHCTNNSNDEYMVSDKLRRAAKRSAIAEHLLQNKNCGIGFTDSNFKKM